VHATGCTAGSMSDDIINHIQKRYEGWRVVQVGSLSDKNTPFEDQRKNDIWDTVKIISQCSVFIGVDSSLYHVANCYPHIQKKIIISKYSVDILDNKFAPCREDGKLDFEWLDFNCQFFNITNYDRGATMSYQKI
jgi:hypothetical protein